MQKLLLMMMLLNGISLQTYAQSSTDVYSLFELKNNPFHRKFYFDLGKGNRMLVETTDITDLFYLQQIDSIVDVFIDDIQELADSLPRETYSRTIEYSIDGPTQKRISISKTGAPKSNYMLSHGELTNLKLGQDTVIINGVVPRDANGANKKKIHYFRISFFLNDLNDLGFFKDHLDEKINRLYVSYKGAWYTYKGEMHLKNQPDISSTAVRGNIGGGRFLNVRPSIDIQNYKNYFVASVSTAAALVVERNLVHQEYCFGNEFHFMFKRNNDKTETYINHFIVVSYGQGRINPNTKKMAILYPFISLGYLRKRRGDFYDKHSFKLGLAQLNLFGNYMKVEPTVYFHDFFKGVTPSLRITQHF